MRFTSTYLSVVLAVLFVVGIVSSQLVDTSSDFVCDPNNQSDCYLKVFEPTNEWQVIKAGQDIPPGLHVRLNLETLQKEAKLMDPSEQNDEVNNQVILGEQKADNEKHEQGIKEDQLSAIKSKIKSSPPKKSKADQGEIDNFDAAVNEIKTHDGDKTKLDQALETLIDLSHDMEFGLKLSLDTQAFDALEVLISKGYDDYIREKAYRIMASALRNNPSAIRNVLENQSLDFLHNIYGALESEESDTIQKRILGVLQALAQNHNFNMEYFKGGKSSSDTELGINGLIKSYPNLGPESKIRFMNILKDLNLHGEKEKRSEEASEDPDHAYSEFLQKSLVGGETSSHDQFKLFFNKLSETHLENKSLKPSKEFTQWLAAKVQEISDRNERRDDTSEDKDFEREMLKARHLVFGNPNALRKAMPDDEL
ncbi:uncharacterized protein PRCAT00004134001 [Priceomyces carsonii]|uniref:uncharacterized protein n=1 Tax=Priceomyces carsonii TaxID=28549 RepID=UPI002EDB419D|nr:unnamed protein product [Priceomyces carsonii]